MMLSPVAGVYIALLGSKEDKAIRGEVQGFIAKADGYDPPLMRSFMVALRAQKPRLSEPQQQAFRGLCHIVISLDSYVDQHLSPV
jgi:hypothetical protein